MPIPIILAGVGLAELVTLGATALRASAVAYSVYQVKDQIFDVIYQWTQSEGFGEFVTGFLNTRLSEAGIDVQFRNVMDRAKLLEDLDKVAAIRVNAKAGTEFTSIKNLTRDEFLAEVGRIMADRVNSELGTHIATLWPIARLRSELGTELLRQFDDGVDLSGGSLFPRERVAQIEAAIQRNMKGYKSPNTPADPVAAAKNRRRQAKYRASHKQIWVDK